MLGYVIVAVYTYNQVVVATFGVSLKYVHSVYKHELEKAAGDAVVMQADHLLWKESVIPLEIEGEKVLARLVTETKSLI